MSFVLDSDTICAIATPPGKSGIGVVRVSGPLSREIGERILGFTPTPRHAHYCAFNDRNRSAIDQGIALFFRAPHSFTGEDILEFQGHGGYFVLDSLLKEILAHGARMARPGEFTERAFLNGKLDLAQAEAIADLIESSSAQAARSAIRTLQGEFSKLVRDLSESIVTLRVYIEAAIDFSDEEIDFLSEGNTLAKLTSIRDKLEDIFSKARQGALLQEGMSVVIAGKPNAGKSSLLNALAEKEAAIVTDIAGTTRDTLREHLNIDGMPLHVTDTAGLRESTDLVEQEGIRRALDAIDKADRILLVVDSRNDTLDTAKVHEYLAQMGPFFKERSLDLARITIISNKIDLQEQSPRVDIESIAGDQKLVNIHLSAKKGEGISLLRDHLKQCMGYQSSEEGSFTARRRHLEALEATRRNLQNASLQLASGVAPELVAEDLRQAHASLGEITGEFTVDDLLGRIFSSFCIGK